MLNSLLPKQPYPVALQRGWLIVHFFYILGFVENKLEAAIPEIGETASDKVLSIKELKEKYTKYAHTHFIKAPSLVIINKAAKWEIEVTTKVIKEWWRKSRTRPRIISIQALDKMIETAELVQTGIDRYNTPGIEAVSEFENRCMIEGELYKVRITVKQQANRRFVYYYGASKIAIK
jgi:hypothetical protein